MTACIALWLAMQLPLGIVVGRFIRGVDHDAAA